MELVKKGRGRPPGSRNKTNWKKSMAALDTFNPTAIKILTAMAENNKAVLDCVSDVPHTVRLNAITLIVKLLEAEEAKEPGEPAGKDEPVYTGPRVVSTAAD